MQLTANPDGLVFGTHAGRENPLKLLRVLRVLVLPIAFVGPTPRAQQDADPAGGLYVFEGHIISPRIAPKAQPQKKTNQSSLMLMVIIRVSRKRSPARGRGEAGDAEVQERARTGSLSFRPVDGLSDLR